MTDQPEGIFEDLNNVKLQVLHESFAMRRTLGRRKITGLLGLCASPHLTPSPHSLCKLHHTLEKPQARVGIEEK